MSFQLHNFWWLLIWIFLAGGFCYFFVPQQEEVVLGRREIRWNFIPALITALPYVFWAAWRSDAYGDTGVYRINFINMPTGLSNMVEYVASRQKGPAFVVFEYLFKTLISQSSIACFFVVARLQMFLLVRIFRKYSRNYWLSLFFLVASTDYMSWMHNGMRQFIAVTIIFTCIPLLVKRRYLLMCLVVLFAATIHSASLIFLPFIFVVNGRAWNVRTFLYILALIVAIIFLDKVSDFILKSMEDTVYEGDIEIFLNDDGTNFWRVLFYAVPTAMSWVFKPYIDRADDPMINVCVNLSIISTGVYIFSYFTSGILVGSIPVYFSLANYILIPWLITEVFDSGSAVILNSAFVSVYTAFFYYQMGPSWGLL